MCNKTQYDLICALREVPDLEESAKTARIFSHQSQNMRTKTSLMMGGNRKGKAQWQCVFFCKMYKHSFYTIISLLWKSEYIILMLNRHPLIGQHSVRGLKINSLGN